MRKEKIIKNKPIDKKVQKLPIAKVNPDQEIVDWVMTCHKTGDDYRGKFKNRWDAIEGQIRCVHPSDWAKKEDWQTKVFIPQQAKTSETAESYLDKMLFGQKRFFNITGIEKRDRLVEGAIGDIYDYVFDKGGFFLENDYCLKESCGGPGTSFVKVLVDPKRNGLKFVWRSAYNVTVDPSCGTRFYEKQYLTDEYKKPLQELIREVETGESLYKREAVQKIIDEGADAALSKTEEALTVVRGFDGTSVNISSKYKEVNIVEFWGRVKRSSGDTSLKEKKNYSMEDRVIAIANGTVKLRDDVNEYGFIPYYILRIKPRKYDLYGLGFCDNVVDLQDLTNSMINLGFDSLKICSMDIAAVNEAMVKDPASIEYRPLAVWKFKGPVNEAFSLRRQGISALGEIIRGLGVLDQFQQEATGVLRQIQGAQEVSGGGSETLGEYQAKLAMIDNRFLKIGRFIERDYIEHLLKDVFKMIFNPKFFNQQFVDRILGYTEKKIQILDPMTGKPQEIVQQLPKIDFNQIAQSGELCYDFKATGMTQFTKALETLGKLKELMAYVAKTPQLMVLTRLDVLYKRILQAADIQDYEEILKSDEEIDKIMNQIFSGANGPTQQTQGQPTAPQPVGV